MSLEKYRAAIHAGQEQLDPRGIGFLYSSGMDKKQPNPNSEIAKFVRDARAAMGLTQQEFADRFSCTKGNVSAWENGRHEPAYALLDVMANASGVPLPQVKHPDIKHNLKELRVAEALTANGWEVDFLPSRMPKSLLPPEFTKGVHVYVPDMLVRKGDQLIYVEVKGQQPVIQGSPLSVLLADGNVALITKDEPQLIIEELENYLHHAPRPPTFQTWREREPELLELSERPDLCQVPRVKFKLSAGVSGFAVEPEDGNGKPIFFRKDWFDLNGYRPEKLFAVRISGASMEPSLWEGDLVVINTADTRPHDGDVFAINYEGELCIKRLRRDAGEWWAASDNADQRRFSPKRCTEDVKIIGRVVYKQSERI
jgi:phage repressor protein C with HTH and peptisase S24 domain/transcriptional regulator with XRE-family HTH domain